MVDLPRSLQQVTLLSTLLPYTRNDHTSSYVRRWLVYSILTGRYSGSPESSFDSDIKQISHKPFDKILKEREEAELSEAYWNASLPQSLDTSAASSPYFHVFLAAQVKAHNKRFLSRDIL